MTVCFENADFWQLLSYALTCTLASRAPLQSICILVLSGFFVACELSCFAPYPFVSRESGVYIARRFPVPLPLQVYSGKRLLVRQLEVCSRGSPSGEELEGESPRGGERVIT